jgi:hypothetical protein
MHTPGWYVWEPPGKQFTILLGLGLVDRLKAFLEKDFPDGREAGGALLGRTDTATAGLPIITVDDFLPMESDRRHGDFYSVTGKDRQKLRKEVARRAGRNEASIVGFFRSHLRPGSFLDSEDFSMLREFFSAPQNVALLVSWTPAPRGGFFLWENGAIRGHAADLQFPLDRNALESGDFTLLRDPEPALVARKEEPRLQRASRVQRLLWGTLGALLFTTAGLWYWSLTRPDERSSAAPSQVELTVHKAGKALRLSWTPTLDAVRRAKSGIVWIRDGGTRRRMDLDSTELAKGSALYFPRSNDVGFRLELIGTGEISALAIRSESPRSDVAPAPPPAAPKPKPKPSPVHRREVNALDQDAGSGLADRSASPPQVATPDADSVRPPEQQPAAQPASSTWRRFTRQPSTVTASYRPAPESLVRRTFHKVPGAHLIERLARIDNDQFVPPSPIDSPVPQVPPAVARDLPGDHRIDFKAGINKSGGLTGVQLLSPESDPRLADLAAQSLERWRFEPAKAKGRDVSSALIVSFRIRNPVR